MDKRKYTNSQLKWLAENLTSEQMNYLLETADPVNKNTISVLDPTANNNPNGPAKTPVKETDVKEEKLTNQNAQTMETQKNPSTQTAASQPSAKADRSQILTVCKAMKTGKLNQIEPSQLNKFITNANISVKSIAAAIKYAVSYLDNNMKNPSNINMTELRNTVAGMSNCLSALTFKRNNIAESVFSHLRSNGFEPLEAASLIRQQNKMGIMRLGAACNTMNENQSINISESVKSYYEITSSIKNLVSLAESKNININRFKKMQKLTNQKNIQLNETMSALKYASAYYKNQKSDK